jgi:hypothetical protein
MMPSDDGPRLSQLDSEVRDALIRTDFATFSQEAFPLVTPGVDLIWAAYLTLLCALLEGVAHGRRRKLIITVPPRHLGHYPGLDVLCISYGLDLAKGFAQQTQTIMQSDMYVRVFGQILPRRRGALNNFRRLCQGKCTGR